MSLGVSLALLASHVSPVLAANEGWQESNGTWRYVKADGSLATGWLKDGYSWYFMNEDGVMTTSTWVGSHEHWYWIGAGGVMQETQVIEYNGDRYYLKGTGVMARDYVKDGWEYDSEGIGHLLSTSSSVIIDSEDDLDGITTVNGNLYVAEEVADDLTISNVDITGKLVVLASNIAVTVDGVTANGLSIQGTNSEVVLAGDTEVGTVQFERGGTLSADRSFDGTVEEIKVQSSVTEPTEISVEADKVETRTFSEVTLNEPVGEVTVVANNRINAYADVETVHVLSTAPGTILDVSRGDTVDTLIADAPVTIIGEGTIGLVEANVDGTTADEDTYILDVEKARGVTEAPEVNRPSRPSSGGSGGGTKPEEPEEPEDSTVANVSTTSALKEALNDSKIKTINITAPIATDESFVVKYPVTINGNGNTVSFTSKPNYGTSNGNNYIFKIHVTGSDDKVTLNNMTLDKTLGAIYLNDAELIMNDVIVSDADWGAVEIINGTGASLTAKGTTKLVDEGKNKPFAWVDLATINDIKDVTVEGTNGVITGVDYLKNGTTNQVFYYLNYTSTTALAEMMELEPADMPLEDLLPSTPAGETDDTTDSTEVVDPETPDGSVEETPTEPTVE